jgi:anti-anti-sigma regulatory factor
MGQTLEVSPLQIELGGTEVWFRFSDPAAAMLEIPPAFEEQLRDIVDNHRLDLEGRSMHLELGNIAAISSRQLGMILTVREVMKSFGKLQLHNISGSVKHLLQLTGTDRFFDMVSAE